MYHCITKFNKGFSFGKLWNARGIDKSGKAFGIQVLVRSHHA